MLFLRMESDNPKSRVFQSTSWRLYDSATGLTVRKKTGSKFLLCFCFLTLFIANLFPLSEVWMIISPPCLLNAWFSDFFFFFFFFILRFLSFLHISCVPVLSSFKDVFFEFHDLVIVFLSGIKLIVLDFDLSRFFWFRDLIPSCNSHWPVLSPVYTPQNCAINPLLFFAFICLL